jgi:hypothetical protein
MIVTNSGDITVSIERVYLGSSEVIHHTKKGSKKVSFHCSFQKMYATLHLQYRGRSSISLNDEAKPWRQRFQSHEETLYSAGSSNVPADYAYLFVYTASMFVEHSTVALLVSIAFLLFFHALIFPFDRMSQSKAFRDMWRENISLRESKRLGWQNMLLLGRSDANQANVDALIHATHDVVKAGTINALKLSTTVARTTVLN